MIFFNPWLVTRPRSKISQKLHHTSEFHFSLIPFTKIFQLFIPVLSAIKLFNIKTKNQKENSSIRMNFNFSFCLLPKFSNYLFTIKCGQVVQYKNKKQKFFFEMKKVKIKLTTIWAICPAISFISSLPFPAITSNSGPSSKKTSFLPLHHYYSTAQQPTKQDRLS